MTGFGIFTLSIALGIALAAGLQARPLRPDEVTAVKSMVLGFGLCGLSFVVESFAVDHEYDDAGITYRTLWSGRRRVAWSEIERVQWRPVLKWLDFVPRGGGRALHFSPLFGGLAPFAQLALHQIPAFVVAAQPEAKAALDVMAAGKHSELMASGKKPTAILSELVAAPTAQPAALSPPPGT
jgi:hypothetical protein